MPEPPGQSLPEDSPPWQGAGRGAPCLPEPSLPASQDNTVAAGGPWGGPHQTLWARRVVSLILPSMEAVRQVPQSTAVLQSTVTTGARWPPRLKQLSRTFSSPPSCKGTGEMRLHHQALLTNTSTLSTFGGQAASSLGAATPS